MFEKFRDYLYYLLPSPFKRLKKEKNQWYIFFKVIGDEYDKVQAELEHALDQTSVVTCNVDMLQYYAQDRGMYRYPEEDDEAFRSRIALQDEVEALGGTKAGIILAAKTLGYEDVEHLWYPDIGYPDKWSQFLLRVGVQNESEHPVNIDVLIKEVRKAKDSTSLDNYALCNTLYSGLKIGATISVVSYIELGDI